VLWVARTSTRRPQQRQRGALLLLFLVHPAKVDRGPLPAAVLEAAVDALLGLGFIQPLGAVFQSRPAALARCSVATTVDGEQHAERASSRIGSPWSQRIRKMSLILRMPILGAGIGALPFEPKARIMKRTCLLGVHGLRHPRSPALTP
jgi:hypothetical protein